MAMAYLKLRLLDIDVPDDATEINLFSHTWQSFNLRVDFKAPPESVAAFNENVCDGVLLQGYNPFDAIDYATPFLSDPHIIDTGVGLVYSYPGVNTTDFHYGNKCWKNGQKIEILIDKTNPDLYKIVVELTG